MRWWRRYHYQPGTEALFAFISMSPRLIHKQNIYAAWRRGSKDQLFPGQAPSPIKIIEKYQPFRPSIRRKSCCQIYRDSILMELKNYSMIEYNIFRKAEIELSEAEDTHGHDRSRTPSDLPGKVRGSWGGSWKRSLQSAAAFRSEVRYFLHKGTEGG